MSIKVNSLTKSYGEQNAIDSISFQAKPGEITGLVGPNGAGKTTTMKILTCYMPATSGSAHICDLDTTKDDLDIRKLIGYLPEHNPLYGSMYIKEYLRFIANVHKLKNPSQRVNEVIDMVGLSVEKNKKISQISKGYKQRVGIAQAIIHDPKVLILDEPISGLDPNQLQEIRQLILNLKKDKTIIFSSHILQEVESICDKIVILNKGQIVADDTLSVLNQSMSESVQIEIEFLNAITQDALQRLGDNIKVVPVNSKKYILQSQIDQEHDIRTDIFDLAVSENNKLLSMSMQKSSLENVFKSVTNSDI